LPIATLAVWDRRDRLVVHLAILASILWSQPFWLPINGDILLGLKLGALYAVGAIIASRAADQDSTGTRSTLFRPAFARIDRRDRKALAISDESAPGSRSS
jgi:hypothetical protein